MKSTIRGEYKSYSKYEAAAEVLVNLCWGEGELESKLQTIFGGPRTKWMMSKDQPIEEALYQIFEDIDVCDVIEDLAELDPVGSVSTPDWWNERKIHIAGMLACGDIGDAIRYCSQQLGFPDPLERYQEEYDQW